MILAWRIETNKLQPNKIFLENVWSRHLHLRAVQVYALHKERSSLLDHRCTLERNHRIGIDSHIIESRPTDHFDAFDHIVHGIAM